MLTTLKLHGDLERFGASRELALATPFEAFQAVEALRPGFLQQAKVGQYCMVIEYPGEEPELVDEARGNMPISGGTLHVVPTVEGEYGQAIAWTASQLMTYFGGTTAAAAAVAVAVATVAVSVVISMALSGVANMLWPLPKADPSQERPDNKPSYYFNGPVNTIKQGNPVALCYGGPLLVGSQVISVAINTEELALDYEPE
jgi:predicted phage tail protein